MAINGSFNAGLYAAELLEHLTLKIKSNLRKVETYSNSIHQKKTKINGKKISLEFYIAVN